MHLIGSMNSVTFISTNQQVLLMGSSTIQKQGTSTHTTLDFFIIYFQYSLFKHNYVPEKASMFDYFSGIVNREPSSHWSHCSLFENEARSAADLRISSVSSCWQGPLKYCSDGPHKINQAPQKSKSHTSIQFKGLQWQVEDFISFSL